ncbi:hypothetical protein [Novosphingobium sp. KACC 22771]|uniref:hypothetical protein n=1 Tax=Novosphingobium sp. KACC 22771 TaxID=3025670 RepID=UPI0023655C35|nr:hypothetical protein [Novosphingobium sp. KACC 22771]WDF75257.1 hypothetical protein PQ467_19780 [Novosphingobium sp. KACC 22771]
MAIKSENTAAGSSNHSPSAPVSANDPVPTEAQIHLPWYRRRKSIWFKIAAHLSRLTNGHVKSPGYYRSLEFQREHDAKDFERYRISPNEHVRTWCLWTVEFYTPDNIGKLRDALDRLKPAGMEYEERGPGQWLRQNRGRAGNSMELYFVPKGRPGLGIGHYCPLPDFAEGAHGTIENATPSLTILTMHFLLKDSERDCLEIELHRDHPSKITQKPKGVLSISGVSDEQRRAVEDKRLHWISQATSWHRENFPGLLSGNGELVSSCVLDVVDGAEPLGVERTNLLEALDLVRSYEVYENRMRDGQGLLKLSRGAGSARLGGLRLLSINRERLAEFETVGYGNDDDGRVAHIDAMFRRTYTWIALPRVLDFYDRRAVQARDGAAALVGSRNASRALERVRADTAQSIDAAVIARELHGAAKTGRLPRCEMDFILRPIFANDKARPLAQTIRERVTHQAAELLADVEALNESLTVQANLLSAHANLKLQPWIITLAVISAIAGVIAAIGPLHDLMWPKLAPTVECATVHPSPSEKASGMPPAQALHPKRPISDRK